jgi:Protein of unknown function (DUF4435)
MPNLIYSHGAADTLPLFHRKRFVIFVEGDEDIPFWHAVLQYYGLQDFELKEAGGVSELEKYIGAIIESGANIVVARDCDYTDISGQQHQHPRILYTYGYSFENSLCCIKSIDSVLRHYLRSQKDYTQEIMEWMRGYIENIRELIVLDVANAFYDRGVEVLGRQCEQYGENGRKHFVCTNKAEEARERLTRNFTNEEIERVRLILESSGKELRHVIRGHYLFSAVLNYVRHRGRRAGKSAVQLSTDALRAMLLPWFLQECPANTDLVYIGDQVGRLLADDYR